MNNNATVSLDEEYQDYLGGISSLAESSHSRGSIYHSEMNYPVYEALQQLATAVMRYGTLLRTRGVISQQSTIATISAGSDIALSLIHI